VAQRVDQFAAEGTRNHFHVWELDTFLELLLALDLPADLESASATEFELAVILRKNPDKRRAGDERPAGAEASSG
jgi:hypothetical protein